MDLKELLGKELYEQVEEKLAEQGDVKLIVNDGDYIPRERLNAKNEELEALQEQLKNRDQQIEQLKGDSQASDELKQRIEELQGENKQTQTELTQKLEQQRKDAAVDKALLQKRARNPKAAKALLDLEKVEVGEGEQVKNLDTQIENLKKEEPYLFEGGEKPSRGGSSGFSGGQSGGLTHEQLEQMTEKEINENWDAVKGLLERQE